MAVASPFVAAGAVLAEGPIWLDDRGLVAWTDIPSGTITAATLDGATEPIATFDEPVGAIALATDGRLIAATPDGLHLLDGTLLAELPEAGADLRMNDGKPDPVGRFVGGTMGRPSPRPGAGALWSFDERGARALVRDVTISNGLCWSADGATMFYIDTPTQRIDAFDYDIATGEVSERRTVVTIDGDDGAPDGLTIDRDGGLWVALWGGSCVRRYEGRRLTEQIDVPTPYVTCPVFAGPELDVLVVTTAAEPFGAAQPPGAGDLYRCAPGVRGRAAHRYRVPEAG